MGSEIGQRYAIRQVRLLLLLLYASNEIFLDLTAANLAQLILGQFFEVVEGAWNLVAGEKLAGEFLETFRI